MDFIHVDTIQYYFIEDIKMKLINYNYDYVRVFHDFSRDEIFDHRYSVCNSNLHDIFSEIKCFHGKLYLEHIFEYMNQFI